jgi:uncharacterized repeat protein (TIGR03847 family)
MTQYSIELSNVQRITANAVGPPGERVFYVQARQGSQLISLLAEKEQVRALADAVNTLLDELAEQNPRLSTSDDMLVLDMSLEEPIEPEFRIARMGLGYDPERDMVVLVLQGFGAETAEEGEALLSEESDSEEDPPVVRLSATRPQMRALSTHASNVVHAGRAVCGNCGRPMDAGGHFCPERNGHGPVMP